MKKRVDINSPAMKEEFLKWLEARIKKSSNLARKFQINSVPTIVVNGKYLTSGSYVSSYDELYSVVNLLVEREKNDL